MTGKLTYTREELRAGVRRVLEFDPHFFDGFPRDDMSSAMTEDEIVDAMAEVYSDPWARRLLAREMGWS